MKTCTILSIAAMVAATLAYTGVSWIHAAEVKLTDSTEITEDKKIPAKPGGIPHELDGSYTQCSTCHQLEIPPHPAKNESCLICHTQNVEENRDDQ